MGERTERVGGEGEFPAVKERSGKGGKYSKMREIVHSGGEVAGIHEEGDALNGGETQRGREEGARRRGRVDM